MQRYKKFEKEIGVGAYGTVYKATDLETNQLVALKRIPLEESEDGIPATAVREMSLLKQLHHPNIVSLQNIVLEINLLYLVFELGDLDLKKLMDLAFKEKTHGADGASTSGNSLIANMKYHDVFCMDAIRSNMHQIIDGLAYCHSMGVMHRDLKPQNILVSLSPGAPGSSSSCQFRIKIADFGLARAFMPKRELTLEVVTRWYRPPEILLGSNTYSPSVDIWSIGCIFAELLNQGIPLLPGSSEIDQIHKIFYHFGTPDGISWPDVVNYPHWRPTFPLWPPLAWGSIVPYDFDKTPPAAIDLLASCFVYDPKLRITASNALRHPWFQPLSASSPTPVGFSGTKRPQIVSPPTTDHLSSSALHGFASASNRETELLQTTSKFSADLEDPLPVASFSEDSNATTVSDISATSSSSCGHTVPADPHDDCADETDTTVVLSYGHVADSACTETEEKLAVAGPRAKKRKVRGDSAAVSALAADTTTRLRRSNRNSGCTA